MGWNGFALDEAATYAILAAEFNPRCVPPWSAAELMHKVRSAAATAHAKPRGHLLSESGEPLTSLPVPTSKWPGPDAKKIGEITASGVTVLELSKRSPFLLDKDDGSNCEEIVQALFTDDHWSDPLLCAGKSKAKFATRRLSKWLASGKLSALALLVPSPMLARTGKTKDGKESEHTLENTGPRRFLVIEFDQGTADNHAARLWHLAEFAPLVLVVHSGGKSLHGWFFCLGQSEHNLRRFSAMSPTTVTVVTLDRHIFTGQVENGIFVDAANEIWIYQKGTGYDTTSQRIANYASAPFLWFLAARKVRELIESMPPPAKGSS